MPVRRKRYAARLVKPFAALLALAAGIGVAVAAAAVGPSTELGGTTTAPMLPSGVPIVQLSTTAGTSSYSTPDGVLTSWRYHSGANPGLVRLELFKRGTSTHGWQVVAASDAKPVAANTGYEFNERIPVKKDTVLGLDSDANAQLGIAAGPDDQVDQFSFDQQVGDSTTATSAILNFRVNVAATVEPDADADGYGDRSQDGCPTQAATQGACSNRFSFGRLKRKRSNGTAKLPVTVPGPGKLSLHGAGVVGQRPLRVAGGSLDRTVSAAGTVKLRIKAKGKAKRRLTSRGKVKVSLKVTYTPTDGKANTKKPKVKLVDNG